jgi:tellurite resistance protein TerC
MTTAMHAVPQIITATAGKATGFADLHVRLLDWVVLGAAILALLAIDLFRHREAHAPTNREAALESGFWVLCGLAFAGWIAFHFGATALGEYLAGYVTEKSLSVDNVFVWSVIFSSFAIPTKYQHRVLFWGIFGALALRTLFVFLGSAVIAKFWWSMLLLGALLLWSGVKVLRHRDDEGEEEHNAMTRLVQRFVPVSDDLDGQKFFTTRTDTAGKLRRIATPLFVTLLVVELTDVLFAVDSVPAILAISREPYLVLASNAFAILGLRAMYFLLANAKARFHYLSHALGAILIVVGMKMIASHWWHPPVYASLGVIAAVLAAGIIASEIRTRRAG